MLDEYYETLMNGEKPIIHSDRGAHYRWQNESVEWAGMDFKEVCPRNCPHLPILNALKKYSFRTSINNNSISNFNRIK